MGNSEWLLVSHFSNNQFPIPNALFGQCPVWPMPNSQLPIPNLHRISATLAVSVGGIAASLAFNF